MFEGVRAKFKFPRDAACEVDRLATSRAAGTLGSCNLAAVNRTAETPGIVGSAARYQRGRAIAQPEVCSASEYAGGVERGREG